jgi:pimeloyl-ACP methyl ester carboxylesterase
VKIHLIGHSIGSWMIMELLKRPEIKRKVHHAYLLFPTVERMAETDNGVRLTKYVSPLMFIFRGMALFMAMMPYSLQVFFIYVYYWCVGMPSSFLGTSLKFSKPSVLDKVYFLGMDEMATVRELDVATMVANQDIVTLYYGTTDGWVPVSYYEDMKRRVPGVRAELCRKKLPHAFVLKHGPDMAHICGNWIAKNRAGR